MGPWLRFFYINNGTTIHIYEKANELLFVSIDLFNPYCLSGAIQHYLWRAGKREQVPIFLGKRLVKIERAEELLEDEAILQMVNADLVPFTIFDLHKAEFWAGELGQITVR